MSKDFRTTGQLILPLPLRSRRNPTFGNFYPGRNLVLLNYLKQFVSQGGDWLVYLWGDKGVGLTHLLQASCHAVLTQKQRAIYLSLQGENSEPLTPAILDQLENYDFIALDDIDSVVGILSWEEALFHFYHRIQQQRRFLLLAGHASPASLSCQLSDLRSRLMGSVNFEVLGLQDEEKLQVLQCYAQQQGLELPREVGHYLLRYYPRNLTDLMEIFEKLDRASMAAQRRLTIPFIKNSLSHSGDTSK